MKMLRNQPLRIAALIARIACTAVTSSVRPSPRITAKVKAKNSPATSPVVTTAATSTLAYASAMGARASGRHTHELGEGVFDFGPARSEEHTSELQSRGHLVCRLLLE